MPLSAVSNLIGGLFNAGGAVKQNAENKGQQKRLGWQIDDARWASTPIGTQLVEGYQPGGWYRTGTEALGLADAEAARGMSDRMYRAGLYRTGGIRSGGVRDRGWAALMAKAPMDADLSALTGLTNMDLTKRGVKATRTTQEPLAVNPWGGYAAAFNGAAEGLRQTGAGNRIVR